MTEQPIRRKLIRWVKRGLTWMLFLCLSYGVTLLVGLVPINNDFTPAENGVKVYIVSNAVHADIIVPKKNDIMDWSESFSGNNFLGDTSQETHVAFGWGDRGFFLETETWDDFRLATAANALLLPSKSCLHVSFTRPANFFDSTSVSISRDQYKQLVEFINGSFKIDGDNDRIQIEGYAFSRTDAFFDAHGRYHILNTCNSWAGRALKMSGVRTPWLSPMPKSPMIYIESEKIAR
ncbi:TIGR02117 family protein [bacterium]|nr:TIGR02117 family protein [bacterium]